MQIIVIQKDNLKKYLKGHLQVFEKIDQWTDLGNWLQKTAKFLESYPTKYVPYRKNLAKRLSQCLNGNLPIGIHKTTLSIYCIIFDNLVKDKELFAKEIFIYSFGLFPFFTRSSIQVKPELIDIFKIVPMLSGLMGSLMTGLEEQDEDLKKNIFGLFDQINQIVGNKFYLSTLWAILLKNSKNRNCCFKVLNKKYKSLFELEEDIEFNPQLTPEEIKRPNLKLLIDDIKANNSTPKHLFPNISMIVNAICMCLEDVDIMIQKNALDFLLKYQKNIQNEEFMEQHQLKIYNSLFLLLQKKDLSIQKRVSKILFQNGDLNQVKYENINTKDVEHFCKTFTFILNKKIKKSKDAIIPFSVLRNLAMINQKLMEEILVKNSFKFFNFIYQEGYLKKVQHNSLILEQIKTFINEYNDIMQKTTSEFEEIIKNDCSQIDVDFLGFVLKFLILDYRFPIEVQFKFIVALMQINAKILQNCFINVKEIQNRQNLPEIVRSNLEIENLVGFVQSCIFQSKDLVQYKSQKNESTYFKPLVSMYTNLVEDIIKSPLKRQGFLPNFQIFFDILMVLDYLSLDENQIDQSQLVLPDWVKLLLQNLQIENETLNYQSLKFLFKFFDYQASYFNIRFYLQKIFQDELMLVQILTKSIDLMEISDFKFLCFEFFRRFAQQNQEIVITHCQKLLKEKDVKQFIKMVNLWKLIDKSADLNCQTIIECTAEYMLQYHNTNNPIQTNHFNNWLIHSNTSFNLVLDVVLKKLLVMTKWKKLGNDIVFETKYDCLEFQQNLKNLRVIFKHSQNYFSIFISEMQIKDSFKYYYDQLFSQLEYFQKKENIMYLDFIILILLRFYVGLSEQKIEDEQYELQLDNTKDEIAIFLESILKKTSDEALVAYESSGILQYVFNSLNLSFKKKQISSVIVNLNFIKFLLFNTGVDKFDHTQKQFQTIILNGLNLNILTQGLKSDHVYMVEEFNIFLNQFNVLINTNFKHPNLTKVVQVIMDGYLNTILEKFYGVKTLMEEENSKTLQVSLLNGLRLFLEYYLKETHEEIIQDSNPLATIFSLGLYKKSAEKKLSFKKDRQTCKKIIDSFPIIFQRLLVCWRNFYTIKDFKIYNPNFQIKKKIGTSFDTIEINAVTKSILNLAIPLSQQFKGKIVEVLLIRWMKNNTILNTTNFRHYQINEDNAKILDMLNNIQIQPNDLFFELVQTNTIQQLQKMKRFDKNKNKELFLIKHDAYYENNVLSFIYSYLKYSTSNFNIEQIFEKIFNLLFQFSKTNIPQSLCYILDIIHLLVHKYNFEIKKFEYLKSKNMMNFLTDVIQKLIKIISGETIIRYCDDQKQFDVVLPLNPTTFERADKEIEKQLYKKQIEKEEDLMFDFLNLNENSVVQSRYKYFCAITLMRTFGPIAKFFYNDYGTFQYNAYKIRLFFEKLFKMLQNRGQQEQLILEKISKLILDLIRRNELFLDEFKKEILETFESDEFFNCEVETLKIWSKIMDAYLTKINPNIVILYFGVEQQKINYVLNHFKEYVLQYIVGKLKRHKEKFLNKEKLKIFLMKIKEVLKDEEVHPNLIILVFFSLRILILRLKQETLDNLFKSMWPSILFLLEKMIKNKKMKDEVKQHEIIIAALKLLELISFTDIEEFNLHRWAFLFDYYGVKIQFFDQSFEKLESPFINIPALVNNLPKGSRITYTDQKMVTAMSSRKIMLMKNNLEGLKIESKILEFLNYWIELSNQEVEYNREHMESLIQGDFIDFRKFVNL